MGGYNSGRSGGRPTVEGSLTLNLGKLIRDGTFQRGQTKTGSIVWTNTYSGMQAASIGYQAYLDHDHGRVRLLYTTTRRSGEKHVSDYWIELTATPQPFGGWRWWFVCPHTGDHALKLHQPSGAVTFASRRAYRLGYQCQRETPRDRALRQAFKCRRVLGSDGGIGDYIEKPKGMRWATFDREMAKVAAFENTLTAHTWILLQRLNKRLGR